MTIATTALVPLLQVYDMREALAFYCDVLGFELFDASPIRDTPEGQMSHWVWLRLGPAQLMLNSAYDEGERPPARVRAQQRWHVDTCLYFYVDDIAATHAYLSSRLPEINPPQNAQYGMRQLYLRDPDGYNLCFQARGE
jgi:glyoxylase I family protein